MDFFHILFIGTTLFSVNYAVITDDTCFSVLTLGHTWTATTETQNATMFGCGPNGDVQIPCIQGGTQITPRCINSGGSAQNLLSVNLAVMQATHFQTNIGFCHAGELAPVAGGTVSITVRFNNSGVAPITQTYTLNSNVGACSDKITIPAIGSIPPNVVIDELEIQILSVPMYDLAAVSLFSPELCSSIVRYAEPVAYDVVDHGSRPLDHPDFVNRGSAGRLTCPYNGEETDLSCFAIDGDIGDSSYRRVPSFWEPREYFGNSTTRGFALRIPSGDLYVYSGFRCFDFNALNQQVISVGSPGSPFFAPLTHVIEISSAGQNPFAYGFLPYDVGLFMKSPGSVEAFGDGPFAAIFTPLFTEGEAIIVAGSILLGAQTPFGNFGISGFNFTTAI